jgi:preprotein translocase subunit SecG
LRQINTAAFAQRSYGRGDGQTDGQPSQRWKCLLGSCRQPPELLYAGLKTSGAGRRPPSSTDNAMLTVVIVIHLMVVTALIGFVLLQKSEGGGLGMGGGSGFMTSRGTTNVLTRTTAVLAAVFFVTSLSLSIIAGLDRKPRSIVPAGTAVPGAPATPGAPPPLSQGGGILDQLGGGAQAPGAPAAPSGPQVPRSQ